MVKAPLVSVVIPSWNSRAQLARNLPAVFAATKELSAELIVIDDKSSDDSWSYLNSLSNKLRLYQNQTNRGFAETVNRGVQLARGQYLVLLNTDVRPKPGCFKHALKYFTNDRLFAATFNSGAGFAGGRWGRGLFEHYLLQPSKPAQASFSLYASGGQAMFDKAKWLKLGGLDSLYHPFYWEDVDLGYQAWKRGWKIVWAPNCQCVHDHQHSVIAKGFSSSRISRTAQRNQFLFVWKNIHDPELVLSHLYRLPFFLLNYPLSLFSAILRLPKALKSRRFARSQAKLSDRQVLAHWSNL